MRVRNVETNTIYPSICGAATTIAFSRKPGLLACKEESDEVVLRELEQAAGLGVIDQGLNRFAFSPDDKLLVGLSDSGIFQWDVDNKKLLAQQVEGNGLDWIDLNFSVDVRFLLTLSADGIVRVWGVAE